MKEDTKAVKNELRLVFEQNVVLKSQIAVLESQNAALASEIAVIKDILLSSHRRTQVEKTDSTLAWDASGMIVAM